MNCYSFSCKLCKLARVFMLACINCPKSFNQYSTKSEATKIMVSGHRFTVSRLAHQNHCLPLIIHKTIIRVFQCYISLNWCTCSMVYNINHYNNHNNYRRMFTCKVHVVRLNMTYTVHTNTIQHILKNKINVTYNLCKLGISENKPSGIFSSLFLSILL